MTPERELKIWRDMAERQLQITKEVDALKEKPDEWWCWDDPMEPALFKCWFLEDALEFTESYMVPVDAVMVIHETQI
jgi:hypothetical protein